MKKSLRFTMFSPSYCSWNDETNHFNSAVRVGDRVKDRQLRLSPESIRIWRQFGAFQTSAPISSSDAWCKWPLFLTRTLRHRCSEWRRAFGGSASPPFLLVLAKECLIEKIVSMSERLRDSCQGHHVDNTRRHIAHIHLNVRERW